MPMDFPDFDSLKQRAKQRDFRQPHGGETEIQFRVAFADFMQPIDSVEASEIRCGSGWDKMNEVQITEMLSRKVGGRGELLKLLLVAEKMVDEITEED